MCNNIPFYPWILSEVNGHCVLHSDSDHPYVEESKSDHHSSNYYCSLSGRCVLRVFPYSSEAVV